MDNMVTIDIPIDNLKNSRAGSQSTIHWGGAYGGGSNDAYRLKLGIKWWSTGSGNTSSVTAQVFLASSNINFSATKYGAVSVNGNTHNFSRSGLSLGSGTHQTHLATHTVNVDHNSDGNKSITISANFSINITYSGVYVGAMYAPDLTAVLDTLLTPPGAPTWCNLDGRFENGHHTTASWGGAWGNIAHYEVQRRFWIKHGEQYSDWEGIGNTGATSYQINHSAIRHHAQQVRVRSVNAAGASGWIDSGWIYHNGVNAFDGSNWIKGAIRVWDGSSWRQAFVHVWDGSNWVVPS